MLVQGAANENGCVCGNERIVLSKPPHVLTMCGQPYGPKQVVTRRKRFRAAIISGCLRLTVAENCGGSVIHLRILYNERAVNVGARVAFGKSADNYMSRRGRKSIILPRPARIVWR